MSTTRSQEIVRESIRHEDNARAVWQQSYLETDCFTRRPPRQTPVVETRPSGDHVVPGYAGHVPASKFVIAKTWGNMTRELGNTQGRVQVPGTREQKFYPPRELPPVRHVERQPPMTHHPPGYGGYIRGNAFTFAQTYGRVTSAAIKPLQEQYRMAKQTRAARYQAAMNAQSHARFRQTM